MINQRGFILPYVMYFMIIIFIVITANITIYTNSIPMTEKVIENIKIETLFQMGRVKFLEIASEVEYTTIKHTITYKFPDGDVDIIYYFYDASTLLVNYKISTNDNTTYTITDYVFVTSNE